MRQMSQKHCAAAIQEKPVHPGAGTDSSDSYSSPVRYLDANESLQVEQGTLFNTSNDTKVEHVPIGISE